MPYFVVTEDELYVQSGVKKPGVFANRSDARQAALNYMEQVGWELLQVTTIHSGETASYDFYFKRPADYKAP